MNLTTTRKPTLKVMADDEAAARLRELVKDAEDGLRRVLVAGMYIEWIAASLPHGQLMPWVEEHCPEIPQRTLYRWRTLARSVCEWVGLKFATMANLDVPADKLLTIPEDQLPAKVQPWRKKIETLLAEHSSAKQLFFDLKIKQGELDDGSGVMRAKRGRLKGEGGASAMQRANARIKRDELDTLAVTEMAGIVGDWLIENADAQRIGRLPADKLQNLSDALETALGFIRQYRRGNKA